MSDSNETRFWSKVKKAGSNQCWEWQGARDRDGYGRLKRLGGRQEKREFYAHKLSWEMHFGTIPDGLCVCHHCDLPPCVNPVHLFLGTKRHNNADKKRKGRTNSRLGELNPNVKLTAIMVLEILAELDAGATQIEVAEQFGVKQPQISRIARGENWKTS